MLVSIVRLYHQIMLKLAFRREPEEYTICYINVHNLDTIEKSLHEKLFFCNDLSYRMVEEICNVRKLIDYNFQVHLRIYQDGRVTGHYELRTEHPSDHLHGIGHRLLTYDEKEDIKDIFRSMGVLRC